MSKKRPFASEGHLHLPLDLAPRPRAAGPDALPPVLPAVSPEPATRGGEARARRLAREPHLSAGDTFVAQVLDDARRSCGVRAGDRVLLVGGRTPEFGDVVARSDPEDAALLTLWRAWPEADGLRLTGEGTQFDLPPETPLAGIVVAVWRGLRG